MSESVVHLSPRNNSATTGCCGIVPFELPRTDRLTLDASLVTCGRMFASPVAVPTERPVLTQPQRVREVLERLVEDGTL